MYFSCIGSAFASGSVPWEGDGGSVGPRLTLTNVPKNGPPNTLEHWTSSFFFGSMFAFLCEHRFLFPFSFISGVRLGTVGRSFSTHAPCTFASPLSLSFLLFGFFFNYCSVSIAVMIELTRDVRCYYRTLYIDVRACDMYFYYCASLTCTVCMYINICILIYIYIALCVL